MLRLLLLDILSPIISTQPRHRLARLADDSIKTGGILTLQEKERNVAASLGVPGPLVGLSP